MPSRKGKKSRKPTDAEKLNAGIAHARNGRMTEMHQSSRPGVMGVVSGAVNCPSFADVSDDVSCDVGAAAPASSPLASARESSCMRIKFAGSSEKDVKFKDFIREYDKDCIPSTPDVDRTVVKKSIPEVKGWNSTPSICVAATAVSDDMSPYYRTTWCKFGINCYNKINCKYAHTVSELTR